LKYYAATYIKTLKLYTNFTNEWLHNRLCICSLCCIYYSLV